jgi:hypothetical protein
VRFSEREQALREMREVAWEEAQKRARALRKAGGSFGPPKYATAVTESPPPVTESVTESRESVTETPVRKNRMGRPKKDGALGTAERMRLMRAKRKAGS